MNWKIFVSIIYLIILLGTNIYISSCINILSEKFKCNNNVTEIDNINLSNNTISLFLWLYTGSEFLITIFIGSLIGLNISENKNKNKKIFDFFVTFVFVINLVKFVLFLLTLILHSACISNLSKLQIQVVVFFTIIFILIGIGESLIACILVPEKTNIVYVERSVPATQRDKREKSYETDNNTQEKRESQTTPLLNDEDKKYGATANANIVSSVGADSMITINVEDTLSDY